VKLRLFNYWRSSASQRVRIALGLKGLEYEYVVVNILKKEQQTDAYRAMNPIAQVPTLELTEDDGTVVTLTQSLPIIEFLDERFPDSPLLPTDRVLRAKTRALAEIVNSGIQPLQNLPVMGRLDELGVNAKETFVPGFIASGLVAYAKAAAQTAGAFSVGDTPSIADCFLVPQLGAARRFNVPLDAHTQLLSIEANCLALPAFVNAAPDRQQDAVKS
jgi:maleylpyruvate isomerase